MGTGFRAEVSVWTTPSTFMKSNSLIHSRVTVAALFSLVLAALAFSGCQTMEGAGKDIERAGEKIQENAEKHD